MNPLPCDLILFGAGGHAKVVADLARTLGFNILGFVDTLHPERAGSPFHGSTILGGIESLQSIGVKLGVVAIGDNHARLTWISKLLTQGWEFPVLIHPSAVVASTVTLGAASVVMPQSCIQADTQIGIGCIVNTGSIAEHDSRLEAGVHLAPRACLCGSVTIGTESWIGAGSIVRENLTIGSRAMIGAGSVVVRDIPSDCLAYGVPARVMRSPHSI
jgi:sugar O-acyltransferase (sialic acid O-acetyltransferase NeuD family)